MLLEMYETPTLTNLPFHPLWFSLLTSAPCCSRTLAQSKQPSVTARWRGVRPRGSRASISVWKEEEEYKVRKEGKKIEKK